MSFDVGDRVLKNGFFSSVEGVVVKRYGDDGVLVKMDDGGFRSFKVSEVEKC